MTLPRLHRDYVSEDEASFTIPHREASQKRALDPTGSWSRSTVRRENNETNGVRDHRRGIAHTTGYDATSDESECSEPVLLEAQVDVDLADIVGDTIPGDGNIKSSFSPSVTSMSHVSQDAQSSMSSKSKLLEFFSQTIFQVVLHNPTTAHQLLEFGRSRLCGENMEFLARVTRYHSLLSEVSKEMLGIHRDYLSSSSPTQINLPDQVFAKVNKDTKTSLRSTLPALESVFVAAQSDIERLVFTDVYPKFVRHQMSVSAAKALGGDRARYAGLGDCFVLTDPNKADNPIVYASDGFVKVTGYPRNDIIPRNCRFLQSQQTDKSTVRRLKQAIEKREESVELLLNQRKDGEPFWNLLYTTPLFDEHGKLIFFLGGQVNCSTTIHTASDVLRILAQSKDDEDDSASRSISPQTVKAPRSRSILNVFRTNNRTSVQPQAPGMEKNLLNRMEDMSFQNQMDAFYTAYSNFILINYSTFLITTVSSGIIDLLFPIKTKAADRTHAVGSDIFKFLANHGSGSLSWEFKVAVKDALKTGQPISLDCKLCARPYMGFERFVLHWTPLKDAVGVTTWIVLTLGNERRA